MPAPASTGGRDASVPWRSLSPARMPWGGASAICAGAALGEHETAVAHGASLDDKSGRRPSAGRTKRVAPRQAASAIHASGIADHDARRGQSSASERFASTRSRSAPGPVCWGRSAVSPDHLPERMSDDPWPHGTGARQTTAVSLQDETGASSTLVKNERRCARGPMTTEVRVERQGSA